jgi:hypothetical protein
MLGVFVTFRNADGFDPAIMTKIADEARGLFEGLPGLRYKIFTVDEDPIQVRNFYVWDTEKAAREFFSDALVERVTGLYGVRPTLEFVDIVGVVDNSH